MSDSSNESEKSKPKKSPIASTRFSRSPREKKEKSYS